MFGAIVFFKIKYEYLNKTVFYGVNIFTFEKGKIFK